MPVKSVPATKEVIPPLRDGDRLTVAEFERRYEAMPHVKKAELINGVVYMGSPVRFEQHAEPHALFMSWLGLYWMSTPGTRAGDNASVRGGQDTVPQPDAMLLISPECGGQAQIVDSYVVGAPELVAEIAAEKVTLEAGPKKTFFEQAGVREYLIWQVKKQKLDWFVLRNNRFARLRPGSDGLHRSVTFPGLWLDGTALVAIDAPGVMRALQQGLASAEHAAFVSQLQERKGQS